MCAWCHAALCHAVAWHMPGSARSCHGMPRLAASHAVHHTAACYTVPRHVPRRDVPRPVPCHVPHPIVCHVPPCCATSHAMLRATPCCATSHAVPHQARSYPTPCCRPTPCHMPWRRQRAQPSHRNTAPLCPQTPGQRDTRTQGHNRSVAHGPRSTLYFLLLLYKNTGVPRAHGGHRPSHSTKKY